ncbi:MAG: RsmB/NOP family class I SAM-dependent RNA methyltransferase [Planctomycetota bacterium]|jgi:16S rRNA (cytosine967-C5)-methyltransferase
MTRPQIPKAPSVRALAVGILERVERGGARLSRLVDAASEREGLDRRDRRTLTRITFDTTRLRGLLDAVLLAFGGKPPSRLAEGLHDCLRVGAYEILFSRSVPPYAAVNEAVNAAKEVAGKKAGGYCNAILRKLVRGVETVGAKPDGVGAEAFLPSPDGGGVVFDRPVFPPASRTAEHLAALHAHPEGFVEWSLGVFGREGTARILEEGNRTPPLMVRTRGGGPPAGLEAEATREEDVFRLTERTDPARLSLFGEGKITVQDVTASAPVRALDPAPGERVLDLCAAPGGKTIQAWDRMGGRGMVVALDRSLHRLRLVGEAVTRTGAEGVAAVCADGRRPPFREGIFDRVLVDAPCSNTGVLRRRPEVRWRFQPWEGGGFSALQLALLRTGASLTRQGGRLAYSTCSINPEENGQVVEAFLATESGFRIRAEETVLPGKGDGGYWAVLENGAACKS